MRYRSLPIWLLAIAFVSLTGTTAAPAARITITDFTLSPQKLEPGEAFTLRAKAETQGVALGSFLLRTAGPVKKDDKLPGLPLYANGKYYMADQGRIFLMDNGPLDGEPEDDVIELTVSTKGWPNGRHQLALFASCRPGGGPFVASRRDFVVTVKDDAVTLEDLGPIDMGTSRVIDRFWVEPREVSPGGKVAIHVSGKPGTVAVAGVQLHDPWPTAEAETLPGFWYDESKSMAYLGAADQHTLEDNGPSDHDPAPGAIRLVLDTTDWPAAVRHFWLKAVGPTGQVSDARTLAIKVTDPRDQLDVWVEDDWYLMPGTHFNRFMQLRDGTLLYSGKRSTDGGQTWQPIDGGFGSGALQLRDGRVLGLNYRCEPIEGDPGWYANDLLISEDNGQSFQRDRAKFHVPQAKAAQGHGFHRGPLFMRAIIERKDGSLVALMAGWFKGDDIPCPYGRGRPYSRTYLCESTDGGQTWTYLLTLGYDEIGSEGYNEGDMVRLPDGTWLATVRTGNERDPLCHDNPIMWMISKDEGRTWTEPARTGVDGAFPSLAVLHDGTVAMTYGRPGAMVIFSHDGGRTWTDANVVDTTRYSGYTDVVELEPGVLLVGYGAKDYLDPKTGERSNQIRLARVRYRPKREMAVQPAMPPRLELIDCRMIWDKAPHNAFTDLIRFNGMWYCAFREATTHGFKEPCGRIRVIRSADGEQWESAVLLDYGTEAHDLRDARMTITPDGRLMLGSAVVPPEHRNHRQSLVWFTKDGDTWDGPHPVGQKNWWLWCYQWHPAGDLYAIGYGPIDEHPRTTRLYRSPDGLDFNVLLPTLTPQPESGESDLLFRREDGTAVALVRRDQRGDAGGLIGVGQPDDYTEWTFRDSGVRVGGPSLIELPTGGREPRQAKVLPHDGSNDVEATASTVPATGGILACTRLYDSPVRTGISWVNPRAGTLSELLTLPSGGDTSYPGMVWHEDRLWVSYYASHEGKSKIYLARVRVVR